MIHPIADCEHPLLCLLGPSIVSQETAISGSFQQNLAGICNSVCVWWLIMGCTPWWDSHWMVHPFVSAPNFVSVTPSMGILFPILRRSKVSTLWSSFFLSFMCFANCILGSLSFWANIYLLVKEEHSRKRNTPPLLVGLQACTTTLEVSLEVLQKISKAGHGGTGL